MVDLLGTIWKVSQKYNGSSKSSSVGKTTSRNTTTYSSSGARYYTYKTSSSKSSSSSSRSYSSSSKSSGGSAQVSVPLTGDASAIDLHGSDVVGASIPEGTITSREYRVTQGKDGANDWASEYPGMTFYIENSYKLTELNIPIKKYENCSGIKFYIWRRQKSTSKTTTVNFEKLVYTSKTFSLENARKSDKYQFMDDGITIEFENGGLDLETGQYVLVALPIPVSGTGAIWLDTYKKTESKDFCIRYYGAANASHFQLKERYNEIWYDPALVNGITTEFEKEGYFISGTINFDDDTPPITKVQTLIGKDTVPQGCSIEIYGDSGAGYQKLNTDIGNIDMDEGDETIMKGSRSSFKWKAILKGNGKKTPTLEYDKEKKYAIRFTFTHETAAVGDTTAALNIDKNMCLTSKPFDGDEILKEYIGDMNLAKGKFSNYEFARVWAEKSNNSNLVIDVSGSDRIDTVQDIEGKEHEFSPYSLHYCDLELDDFAHSSVDYSHYDANVEEDENNLRLKLDTDHSYNDNDIQLFSLTQLENVEDTTNLITFSDEGYCKIPKNYAPTSNKLLYRLQFDNPIDLTQYTGVKVALDVKKSNASSELSGLGIYLSSQHESDVPSNILNEPSDIITETNALIDVISEQNSSYEALLSKYKDKIIKIVHEETSADNVKAYYDTYYHYIATYNDITKSLAYKLVQLHDVKTYNIYELGKIVADDDKVVYQEIEIDQNSTNLKYVKEIGVILLADEKDSSGNARLSVSDAIEFKLKEFKSIEHDYYPVFNPGDNHKFTLFEPTFDKDDTAPYTLHNHGDMSITTTTYGTLGVDGTKIPKSFKTPVAQINLKPSKMLSKDTPICYFTNTIATMGYKHIGIQIASDVYIPKYSLKLNLCSDTKGEQVIESIDLPTLNYIWTPNTTGYINLSQVFKKIDTLDAVVKSISISTTDRFKNYMTRILTGQSATTTTTTNTTTTNTDTSGTSGTTTNTDTSGTTTTNTSGTTTGTTTSGTSSTTQSTINAKPGINIFIGKIVLYKAETIPMFHNKMRYKFYNSANDGFSDSKDIMIRKIGTIANYS